MAGHSLTTDSVLQCPHGGTGEIEAKNETTTATGAMILKQTDTFTITGCPFHIPAIVPIPSPCTEVVWIVPDMRVTVGETATLSRSNDTAVRGRSTMDGRVFG